MALGPVVTVGDVDKAVVDYLDANLTDALAEIATRTGMATTPQDPREILVSAGLDAFTDVTPPFMIVISPGAQDVTRVDGALRVTWIVGVATAVMATDERSTRALVSAYTAAVRTVIAQSRTLGTSFIDAVTVIGERYDAVHDGTRKRVWQVGVVDVNVVTPVAAVIDPPDEDDPLVVTHHETVNPLDEE